MPQQWLSKIFPCVHMIENVRVFHALMGVYNFWQINCNFTQFSPTQESLSRCKEERVTIESPPIYTNHSHV